MCKWADINPLLMKSEVSGFTASSGDVNVDTCKSLLITQIHYEQSSFIGY